MPDIANRSATLPMRNLPYCKRLTSRTTFRKFSQASGQLSTRKLFSSQTISTDEIKLTRDFGTARIGVDSCNRSYRREKDVCILTAVKSADET